SEPTSREIAEAAVCFGVGDSGTAPGAYPSTGSAPGADPSTGASPGADSKRVALGTRGPRNHGDRGGGERANSGNSVPHLWQFFAIESLMAPHWRHGFRCNAVPQSLQNLAPAGLGWPQKGHWGGNMDVTRMAEIPQTGIGTQGSLISQGSSGNLAYTEIQEMQPSRHMAGLKPLEYRYNLLGAKSLPLRSF